MQADSSRWLYRDPKVKTEDALIRAGLAKNKNIEKKKKMLEEQLVEDCNNFRPKINKKSKAINNNNNGG